MKSSDIVFATGFIWILIGMISGIMFEPTLVLLVLLFLVHSYVWAFIIGPRDDRKELEYYRQQRDTEIKNIMQKELAAIQTRYPGLKLGD